MILFCCCVAGPSRAILILNHGLGEHCFRFGVDDPESDNDEEIAEDDTAGEKGLVVSILKRDAVLLVVYYYCICNPVLLTVYCGTSIQ